MADDILSRILILLDADSSRFTQELNHTEAVADTSFSKIRDKANMMGVGIAAAAVAGAAALAALTAETIAVSFEIQNAAAVAGISAEQMQYYAVGAKQLGIEQDALGDILADTAEKMGEFAATEGGGLADFFENIAGKTDLTAEAFMKLKPPEALIAMVAAAEKANLSYEQTRFYLESFASDSTRLLPLLKNGGEGFKAYGDAAQRAGAILSDDVIAGTNDLMAAQFLMEQQVKGLKNEIVKGVMPTIVQLGGAFTDTANDGVNLIGVSDIINGALKGIAKTAVGAVATVDLLGDSLNKVSGWKGITKTFDIKDFFTPGGVVRMFQKSAIEAKTAMSDEFGQFDKKLDGYASILEKLNDATSSQNSVAALSKFMDTKGNIGRTAALEAAKAQADAAKTAQSAADAAAKAIQQAYASSVDGLQRQIDLLGKTTELDKFRYELQHGNLTKLAPLQKQQIENLAAVLDAKKHEAEYTKNLENLDLQIALQNISFDIDKHMYELERTRYQEFPEGERAILLEKEKVIKINQDYLGLFSSLKNAEEKRFDTIIEQLEKTNNAFSISEKSAAAYAENMLNIQRIFDGSTILPGITTGELDESGVDAAQAELENRYLMEQDIRNRTIEDKAALNEALLSLELDYIIRRTALNDQMQKNLVDKEKATRHSIANFYTQGLNVIASSTLKFSKQAREIQKWQSLYEIAKDTRVAAMKSFKWASGWGGPPAGFAAAGLAIAYGALQAKAVLSDDDGQASPGTPSTASNTVTPVAEQPTEEVAPQTTTIAIREDTLFTGRQIVDLLNEAVADGKRINANAISFIGT